MQNLFVLVLQRDLRRFVAWAEGSYYGVPGFPVTHALCLSGLEGSGRLLSNRSAICARLTGGEEEPLLQHRGGGTS